MPERIELRVEIFREGDSFVGVCPELNVSSFGSSISETQHSVREALEAFIEECDAMGTLPEVLEEAGLVLKDGIWLSRQPVASELVAIG